LGFLFCFIIIFLLLSLIHSLVVVC
jgi:hypothetical protein